MFKKRLSANEKHWDLYFLKVAKDAGSQSKCLSRKIGAALVADRRYIIATGYNGPPVGFPHCGERHEDVVCPRRRLGYESGKGLDICPAVHAERNTLLGAARQGTSTKGSTLYCYCGFPCKDCLIELINAGVKEIVCIKEKEGQSLFYDELSKEIYTHYWANGILTAIVYDKKEVEENHEVS